MLTITMDAVKGAAMNNHEIEVLAREITAGLNGNRLYREISLKPAANTTADLERRLNALIYCGPPQRSIRIRDHNILDTPLAIQDVVISAKRRNAESSLVVSPLPLGQVALSLPDTKSKSNHGSEVPPDSVTLALRAIEFSKLFECQGTILRGEARVLMAGDRLFPAHGYHVHDSHDQMKVLRLARASNDAWR